MACYAPLNTDDVIFAMRAVRPLACNGITFDLIPSQSRDHFERVVFHQNEYQEIVKSEECVLSSSCDFESAFIVEVRRLEESGFIPRGIDFNK
jgi:hypothetical protein